jgi:hypothetical protein
MLVLPPTTADAAIVRPSSAPSAAAAAALLSHQRVTPVNVPPVKGLVERPAYLAVQHLSAAGSYSQLARNSFQARLTR